MRRPGFTIIEVTIVLAVAALIIAMVFLAVQNAQRSSRDTKRKADALALSQAVEQWAQNHSGKLPDNSTISGGHLDPGSEFCTANYLPNHCGDFKDPLNQVNYNFHIDSFKEAPLSLSCTGGGTVPSGNTPATIQVAYNNNRDFTIKMCLESGEYTLNP